MSFTAPFRVILRMEIQQGKGPEFEAVWLSVGRIIADQPANLGQSLARATEEPDVYYVVTDWTDEPAFRSFETSEAHVDHRRRLQPFRRAGTMTVTEVVHQLPPTAGETAASEAAA